MEQHRPRAVTLRWLAVALAITALLSAVPAPAVAQAPTLEYSVTSAATDIRHLMLRRQDGVLFLAVWRESNIWDPVRQTAITPTVHTVRVRFGRSVARAVVYRPDGPTAPERVLAGTSAIDVQIGASLRLIRIEPGFSPAPMVGERPVEGFLDSIGVNVHFTYYNTAYGNASRVIEKLRELGVRHVRDGLAYGHSGQVWALNQLAAAGIKADLIMGSPRGATGTLPQLVGLVKQSLRGAASSLEGPNEQDLSGDTLWAERTRAYQAELYALVKADPALASLPVVAPSLGRIGNRDRLGDMSASADLGNLHSYPGARTPSYNLSSELSRAAVTTGSKPILATETGYHNALRQTSDHPAISEYAAGVYMPRVYFEYFRRGVRRTFAYELVDEWANPTLTQRESHFGLLRNDFSPKPAYSALRNLVDVLEAPAAP